MPDQIEARSIVRGDERRTHETRAGADWHRDFERAVAVGGHAHGKPDPAVRPHMRALAIDDERELFAGDEAADAEVLNRELVFAVRGKVVTGDDAAARAEGHVVETLVLRGVARRQIRGFGRRLPVANGHAGDPRGRGRVGLEQRRGDRQRAGNVVEAVRGIVRRQQRGDVDPQVEQIADGVGVLRPVQPVQDHGPGIHVRRRCAIDFGFEPVAQPLVLGERRARDVGGRHHAGAQLPDHLLPHLGVVRHLHQVEALQRQIGGLESIVVTGDAVLVQQRAWLFDGSPRRGCRGGLRGLPAQRADRGGQAHPGRGDDSPHPIHGVSVA